MKFYEGISPHHNWEFMEKICEDSSSLTQKPNRWFNFLEFPTDFKLVPFFGLILFNRFIFDQILMTTTIPETGVLLGGRNEEGDVE